MKFLNTCLSKSSPLTSSLDLMIRSLPQTISLRYFVYKCTGNLVSNECTLCSDVGCVINILFKICNTNTHIFLNNSLPRGYNICSKKSFVYKTLTANSKRKRTCWDHHFILVRYEFVFLILEVTITTDCSFW